MKKGKGGLIIGIVFILVVFLIILLLINNSKTTGKPTGNIVLLNATNYGGALLINSGEKILLNEKQNIEANNYYIGSFFVSEASTISLKLDSDTPINYILLLDSEAEKYKQDKDYTSVSFRTKVSFLENSYALERGLYSIIIKTTSKPANFSVIVKKE